MKEKNNKNIAYLSFVRSTKSYACIFHVVFCFFFPFQFEYFSVYYSLQIKSFKTGLSTAKFLLIKHFFYQAILKIVEFCTEINRNLLKITISLLFLVFFYTIDMTFDASVFRPMLNKDSFCNLSTQKALYCCLVAVRLEFYPIRFDRLLLQLSILLCIL